MTAAWINADISARMQSLTPTNDLSSQRRLDMLAAMGIDVWVRRSQQAETATANEAVAPPAAPLSEAPAGAATQAAVPATTTPVAAANPDAGTLTNLAARVASCTACPLHETRTQTVFGVGDPAASCLIIGEAPGAEEDRRGEPFVGRAGQLLNAMLAAIGFRREQVYIANILKCRPPRNRDPEAAEVEACSAFLAQQIELIRPRVIVAVGRIAAQNLLGVDTPIGRMRGQRYSYGPAAIPVVVTYHPAYLLRSPGEKAKSWQDLQMAAALLAEAAA